jgi:uncharacterized protein YjdB
MQLSAAGVYEDGAEHDLNAPVAWESAHPDIVAVNDQGVIKAMKLGVSRVSATILGVTGLALVRVEAPALVTITISPGSSSLPVGESEQLAATGTYSDGTTQNLTQSVNWSSESSIANVSSGGVVFATATGYTTINASSGPISGAASLTVTPPVLISLNVVPASASMVLGSSRQFQAIGTMSDGSSQNLTGIVTWSSSQPGVAHVSSGLAVSQQVGSTSIVAQSSGISGSASLTVTPILALNYFDRANDVSAGYDGTVRMINPGVSPGDLCAMVYVFDTAQELNECCGCSISDSGLRTLSVVSDLTDNPLTGKKPKAGTIIIVPSNPGPNGVCDASAVNPNGVILGWATNAQPAPESASQVTETSFRISPLNTVESTVMAAECGFIEQAGGGRGVCSCGTGD